MQVEQRGSSLQLAFDLPSKDRSGRALKEPFVIQVQRRELNPDERGDCGSCPKDYQPSVRIDPEFPDPAIKFGKRIVLLDAEVRAGKQYQYRLQATRKDGESSAPVESQRTAVCTAPPAPILRAKSVYGGYIVLEVSGQLPENAELVGYGIYRVDGDTLMPYQPLVTTLAATSYQDQTVQRGVRYRYAARMIVRRGDDVLASSELSPVVEISVADDPN